MNEIKVSVIVPIYNTEKFLRKCIESIVNQTLQEIEIILINDGSTDNSHDICLEYAEKYPEKIRYINNKNIGCSATRNLGIELAQGEYIAFVDSDDYIEKEMYKEMYEVARNKNLDVVVSGIIYEKDGKKIKTFPKKIIKKYDWLKLNRKIANPVNKIFRTNFIKNQKINFPLNTHSGEDIVFCFEIMCKTEKVLILNKSYYHYILHGSNSIYDLNKKMGIVVSYKELYKFLLNEKESNLRIKKLFYNCFHRHCLSVMYFAILNPIKVSEEDYKKYDKIFYEELKKIEFLTLKSKFLIFYYRSLVFLIRKFRLYFFLKKLKNLFK